MPISFHGKAVVGFSWPCKSHLPKSIHLFRPQGLKGREKQSGKQIKCRRKRHKMYLAFGQSQRAGESGQNIVKVTPESGIPAYLVLVLAKSFYALLPPAIRPSQDANMCTGLTYPIKPGWRQERQERGLRATDGQSSADLARHHWT